MLDGDNQKDVNIPENADKILFAEDFVNYVLLQFMQPYLSSGIADYRPVIYNGFNPDVRVAVNFLYRRLEAENFDEFRTIQKKNILDKSTFLEYVAPLKTKYFSLGFDAQKLLQFCIKISTMAVRFYVNGFLEGPPLAVQIIINTLEDFDMASGGWEVVNNISANYARIYVDLDNNLTPESGSAYESESQSSSPSNSDYVEPSCSVIQKPSAESRIINEEKSSDFKLIDQPSSSSDENNFLVSCSRYALVKNAYDDGDAKIVPRKLLHTPSESENEYECESSSSSSSNCSEVPCSIIQNTSEESGIVKDAHKSSDSTTTVHPSGCSEEKNLPTSYSTSSRVRNVNDDIQVEYIPEKYLHTPSESSSSSDDKNFLVVADSNKQKSSVSDGKKFKSRGKEYKEFSVCLSDSDESDVFDVKVPVLHYDPLGRQSAKKRPASSSSSASEFLISNTRQQCETLKSTVDSTSYKDSNTSLLQNSMEVFPVVKTSPRRKHISKTRKI